MNKFLFYSVILNLTFLNIVYSQNNKDIIISSKNLVHGITISSKASHYKQNNITVSTSITNRETMILTKLFYKIILKGKGGKVLMDTVVVINTKERPELLYTPQFITIATERDGKITYDSVENLNYYELFDNNFIIKSKGVLVNSVKLNQKNINSIEVKSLKAEFGNQTYYAPGY